MNAADPIFTSSTNASVPSAIFLDMIGAGDQTDRLDRGGDVSERIEPVVGRRDVGAGPGDHRSDVA